jgi:hypothetical protein
MTLDKKVGKRRDIVTVGDWNTIIDLVQITEGIIKQLPYAGETENLRFPELSDAVQEYFAPLDTEDFNDYRKRVLDEYFGNGIRRGVATLLFMDKVPLGFEAEHPNKKNKLQVHSIIQEKRYQTHVFGNGSYNILAERVIYGVKKHMDEYNIPYSYSSS